MRVSSWVAVSWNGGSTGHAVLHVNEAAPVIGGGIEADGEGRRGVHLPDGVDQDVRHEIMRFRIACQPHEVLAQQGIGAGELREPLLGGAFARHAHGLQQAFAVQGRAYEPGGNLQRRDDGRIEFAYPLPVIEANGADVFTLDDDGHDGRGARLVAGDADAVEALHGVGAEHDALAGHEHRAELVGQRFFAVSDFAACISERFADPLGLDLEPLLAVGADLGGGQGGAVHLRGFAQQAQYLGHDLHGVGGRQQQAAGLGRGREQPFTLLQGLMVEDALGSGGEVQGIDTHRAILYVQACHRGILNWG